MNEDKGSCRRTNIVDIIICTRGFGKCMEREYLGEFGSSSFEV